MAQLEMEKWQYIFFFKSKTADSPFVASRYAALCHIKLCYQQFSASETNKPCFTCACRVFTI